MTDKKFSDEEIIKALELCIQNTFCESCEYREKTDKSDICPIRMDALNLINKQNAEIETLKDNNEHLAVILEETKAEVESIITLNSQLEAKVFEQRKEIERLKKYNTDVAFKHYNDGKAEVASEIFAEIRNIRASGYNTTEYWTDWFSKLAELKKKYTEGEDKPAASEEKHYSPEDVRNMTPQEVREKYTAIRKSMERW